jgi:hypothetical protein
MSCALGGESTVGIQMVGEVVLSSVERGHLFSCFLALNFHGKSTLLIGVE